MAVEVFDAGEIAPNGFHDFTVADALWHEVTFPDYARRYVLQGTAALEIAYRTVNGDGGVVDAADRIWPVVANTPWSQPLSRGKGTGTTQLFVRAPGGAATINLGAESFEGG